VYAGYELQDKDDTQIPLIESKIESISVKDPDGNVTELTVVGETDPYLWFNITKKAGTYTYTVVTKGEDAKTYEATIDWNEPTEATVSFQAPAGAEAVFTAASEDAPAQVDFSKVTADKLLDWTSVKDGYYAIELKIEGVDLSEDNVKYAFRVYGDGTAIEPEIKGDLDCQYVTTDWELGTATMYYVLADGSLYQAKINVVSLTPAEEPAPEVSTYKFSYEVPEEVIAGESYTVPVTIEPETVGDVGYERVRFDVTVTTPEGANVQLLATDTNGVVHDVAQIGYWGPENGFPIGPDYKATTEFTAIFSAPGEYTITFSLVDLDAGEALVTETVEITAIEYVPMAVSSEVPTFKVGKWQEYTVSTVANDDAGRMVRAYFTLPSEATVEYLEQNPEHPDYGKWLPLGNVFGPAGGFPVTDATSKFRAVFSEAGTYTVTVEFKEVGTGEVVATHELEVTVEEPVKLELTEPVSHDAEAKTIVYSFNAEFKLVREFDKPWEIKASELTAEHAHLFQIYLLDENYNYEYPGSVKGEVKDVTWDGDTKTLTITYEGDLEPGRYLVDTWGYTISSLEDVPIDAAENFANAVFEVEKEPAIIADPGVSPADGATVEGVQAFTFGFKSATGNLEELELDVYLGDNTGANRDYAGHLGINLPAGSEAVAQWVDELVRTITVI
jgi:hypothetical protein